MLKVIVRSMAAREIKTVTKNKITRRPGGRARTELFL